jgi:hypothetical protein
MVSAELTLIFLISTSRKSSCSGQQAAERGLPGYPGELPDQRNSVTLEITTHEHTLPQPSRMYPASGVMIAVLCTQVLRTIFWLPSNVKPVAHVRIHTHTHTHTHIQSPKKILLASTHAPAHLLPASNHLGCINAPSLRCLRYVLFFHKHLKARPLVTAMRKALRTPTKRII